MAWTKKLTQLNDVLSDLVPNKDGITKYVKAAGLKPQHINESGNAMDVWSNVLSEADKNSKVDELVKTVLDTYPDNPFLKSALFAKKPLVMQYREDSKSELDWASASIPPQRSLSKR